MTHWISTSGCRTPVGQPMVYPARGMHIHTDLIRTTSLSLYTTVINSIDRSFYVSFLKIFVWFENSLFSRNHCKLQRSGKISGKQRVLVRIGHGHGSHRQARALLLQTPSRCLIQRTSRTYLLPIGSCTSYPMLYNCFFLRRNGTCHFFQWHKIEMRRNYI